MLIFVAPLALLAGHAIAQLRRVIFVIIGGCGVDENIESQER